MKYHPDVNPGAEAKEKFLEILEAYEHLTGIGQAQKSKHAQNLTVEELEKIKDLVQKAAKEKARKKHKERALKLKKQKEKDQTRQYTQAIYLLVAIAILYFSITKGNAWYRSAIVNSNPVETTAVITEIGQNRMVYVFVAGEERIEESIYVHKHKLDMLSGNGLPLKIGHEFRLTYNMDKPDYYEIDYEKVSTETFNDYLFIVSEELKIIYAEEWKDLTSSQIKRSAYCLALLIFNEYKFDGLSTIYFRKSVFLENISNNSLSWYFLRRKDSFKGLIEQCEIRPSSY